MSIDQPHRSSVLLTQRLLWNPARGRRSRPQPVVVLLGPVGSGKTTALKSISQACGTEVVHARFDFAPDKPTADVPTTVGILTRVAFELSRAWKARRRARFTRFTLGLIAVQTPLEGKIRDQDKEKLRTSISSLTHSPRVERAISDLLDVAKGASVLTAPTTTIVRSLLPPLIRTVARWPMRRAKRWHADFPEAAGATPLDALVSLSLANSTKITEWLTAAFLADVRESHSRMAKPDRLTRCCSNPGKGRHWHNWVLLLDDIDHPGGERFVTDLIATRDRHFREHQDEHDPLLVVATSGRWDPRWETWWRAPWLGVGPAEPVPSCSEARYERWADQASKAPRSPYYPVLLEPLTIDETAHILGINEEAPECILAHRATGGLPKAVHFVKDLLGGRQFQPGARDVLAPASPADPDTNPWRERLADLRLDRHLTVGIDELITAAPFATAPWLISDDARILISRRQVGRILTELRTALWSIAPQHEGPTPNYGELHPWLARTLLSALAWNGTCYSEQFEALLKEPDTLSDPVRTAYCWLALGRIDEVVDAFDASFDQGPHQEWIDRLELVIRAPDDQPLDSSCGRLFGELVKTNADETPRDRSRRDIIAELVTARWLVANPFTMPDLERRRVIGEAYERELPQRSQRLDLVALYRAAKLFVDPLR